MFSGLAQPFSLSVPTQKVATGFALHVDLVTIAVLLKCYSNLYAAVLSKQK